MREPRQRFQRRRYGYRYQYIDPLTRQRCSVTRPSRAELEQFKQRLKVLRDDIAAGRVSPASARRELSPLTGEDTIAQLWASYERGVKPRSLQNARIAWKHQLASTFGELRWWQADAAVMRVWQRELERRYAQGTIRLAYAWLSAAYHLALSTGRIDHIPWGDWRPDKPTEKVPACVSSLDDLVALIVTARSFDEREWSRGRPSYLANAVQILHLTGIRQAEACGLGWAEVCIDTDPGILRVQYQAPADWRRHCPGPRPSLPPKGGKPRTQLLHPSAVAALRALREHLQAHELYAPDGPVFPALSNRGALNRGDWRNGVLIRPMLMRKIVSAAGLANAEQWVTHSTRHGFSSLELVASGGNLKMVQQRTGHSSLAVLEGYLHQMGHGLARSQLPELPEHLAAPAVPAPLEPSQVTQQMLVGVPVAPLVDLAAATADQARAWQSKQQDKKSALRRESERSFDELAAEWLAKPDPRLPRPRAVTEAARRHGANAYKAANYRGASKAEAQRAWRASKRATLAAWGKALARARQQQEQDSKRP